VYSGLLKKERKKIHKRIARVMEKLFHDRLSEFYETLAFHFKQGNSVSKAIEYLVKSGVKSLERYALEESHQYFTQAFEILSGKPQKTEKEQELLIDIINRWAEVFYFRGAYSSLIDLLKDHEDLAAFLDDKEKLGMLYTWLGISLRYRDKLKDAYQYLSKALKIGEEIENEKVIGYACTWLSFTCTDLGLLEDATAFGERAQKISNLYASDRTLFITCMRAMGWAYSLIGDCKKITKVGRILLDYGQSQSDTRSISWGHVFLGVGHNSAGDFPSSIECLQEAIQVSVDPLVFNMAKVTLGMSYISDGQLQEAEKTLGEVISFNQSFGSEFHGAATQGLLSIVSLLKGNLDQGLRIAGDLLKEYYRNNKKYNIIGYHVFLGNVYLQIIQRKRPMNFSLLYKNIGFLVKNILFVSKKAEYHFNKAIEVSNNIGAKGYFGQAHLGLGFLHKAKGRIDQAGECFSEALQAFEQCEADVYLKQANEALESLK
jgi:tetratricopeptide (TPR) repeat protein